MLIYYLISINQLISIAARGSGGLGTCAYLPQCIDDIKAIYLFQKSPYSPCGTNLFRTRLIGSRRMRRLCIDYTLIGITHKRLHTVSSPVPRGFVM